jgi:hypothetical protein
MTISQDDAELREQLRAALLHRDPAGKLLRIFKARDEQREREIAQLLQSKIAKYGDGEIVYFNGEAVVPISAVLAIAQSPKAGDDA